MRSVLKNSINDYDQGKNLIQDYYSGNTVEYSWSQLHQIQNLTSLTKSNKKAVIVSVKLVRFVRLRDNFTMAQD